MRVASFPARRGWAVSGIALMLLGVCTVALAAVALIGGAPTALAKGPHAEPSLPLRADVAVLRIAGWNLTEKRWFGAVLPAPSHCGAVEKCWWRHRDRRVGHGIVIQAEGEGIRARCGRR